MTYRPAHHVVLRRVASRALNLTLHFQCKTLFMIAFTHEFVIKSYKLSNMNLELIKKRFPNKKGLYNALNLGRKLNSVILLFVLVGIFLPEFSGCSLLFL